MKQNDLAVIGKVDGKEVILTSRATERLIETLLKLNKGQAPKKPHRTAVRLFVNAIEELMSPDVRFRRLIRHRGIEARYFLNGLIRFVLVDRGEHFDVVAVERNEFAA